MKVGRGMLGSQRVLSLLQLSSWLLVAGLLISCAVTLGAADEIAAGKGGKDTIDISKHLEDDDDGDLLSGIIGGDDHDFGDEEEEGHEDDDHQFDMDGDDEGGDWEDHDIDPEEEQKWREQEEEYFKKADKNSDGMLDFAEYKAAMVSDMEADEEGMEEKSDEEKSADQEYIDNLEQQFKEEDRDSDGMITMKEWMDLQFHEDPQSADYEDGQGHGHMTPEEIAEQKEEALKEFNSTDKNGDGHLTEQEVVDLVMRDYEQPEEQEEQLPKDELREMAVGVFKDMDRNNDTLVTFEEFFDMHMGEPHEHDEEDGYDPHEGEDPTDLDHDIEHHLDKLQHLHGEGDSLGLDHHELEHPDDLHLDHDLDDEDLPPIK